jgi:hypothetical protein
VQAIGNGEVCELRIQFEPSKPKETWAEEIDIRGGDNTSQAVFRVSVDADDSEVIPEMKTIAVGSRETATVTFKLIASGEGKQPFFIQIFQKTRLIQVITPILNVRTPKKKS